MYKYKYMQIGNHNISVKSLLTGDVPFTAAVFPLDGHCNPFE